MHAHTHTHTHTHTQWAFSCFSFHNTSSLNTSLHTAQNVSSYDFLCFSTFEIYAMVLPVLILLTFLPSFRWLAFAAYVGAVFLAVAMIVSE